ncbi:hypothetical protein SAMN05421823_1219 [Catalinimonas alkaloidigena]|uniref:Uncharacterized protein n=1 Tax=Catalinimonas alkaloidigena TaxID=1075417 RepID=A0A1G9VJW0_9BACT|nr:hypothetical protein [Catalinimonas alkaloidigena]SDM72105.1 hypothetical protein SAMN05421823_1219 [Catalinimonas alkaloidigena]
MFIPLSRQNRRTLLLTSLLQQSGVPKQSEGSYDPLKHARQVLIGSNSGSAVAHMVSWHESFHAFLNASTCHGNAMVFAGALAAAAYEGFESLVGRMIDISLVTHETYATVSAIATANRGTIDARLLASYPDYQPLLKSFTDLFPSDFQPVLSVMALAACARAAMQTPIYDTLLAQPCDTWPSIDLGAVDKPDERFALLMTSATIERAIAAMKDVLRDAGGQYVLIADQYLDAITARQVWLSSDTDFLDQISTAGFDVFAEVLHQSTGHDCQFNGQKNRLADLIVKVESFAGDRLQRQFWMPDSRQEDEVSLFTDFRNEHLMLSDNPLPATFVNLANNPDSITDLFVFEINGQRYCQFVAMPSDKARVLYEPIDGKELLTQSTLIVGLRRRWAPPGADPRIEFLVLGQETAPAVFKRLLNAAVEPCIVCSLTLLNYTNWLSKWLRSPDCPANRMCVLIDDDCAALITQHAERGAELHFAYLMARSKPAQDEYTEILCIAASDEPDLIYFTPCSTPFRQSMTEYARRRFTQVHFDNEFIQLWLPVLKRLITHTLREETQFGVRFWD